MTNEIGFLATGLKTAVDGYIAWMKPIQAARQVSLVTRRLRGDLERVLRALLPLTSVESRRFLFIPTAGPWVAYFDNGNRGTDANPPMSVLALRLRCRAMRIVATQGFAPGASITDDTEALMFDIYAPEETDLLNYERSITLMNEGGKWEFDEDGKPLPFEDRKAYKARKVRDRFTLDMLATYAEKLGCRPFDPGFYLPPERPEAVLIEKKGPVAEGLEEFQLGEQEARDQSMRAGVRGNR